MGVNPAIWQPADGDNGAGSDCLAGVLIPMLLGFIRSFQQSVRPIVL